MMRCVTPPVISENLRSLTAHIDAVLAQVALLPRTDESNAAVKAFRADLRRRFEDLEQQRKAVKKAVMRPYEDAERAYKEKVSGPIKAADQKLKEWTDSYQNEVKDACREELENYFNELCDVLHIDFVTFDQCGVTVDMATARLKDPRKARNAIHDFLNRIEEDLRAISSMENAAEVLAEYKQSLSLNGAIAAVNDRAARVRQEAAALQENRNRAAAECSRQESLYTEAPEIIPQKEEAYTTAFSVIGTLAQLRQLKAFLDGNGYTYKEVTANE